MLDRLVVLTGDDVNRDHFLNFANGPVLFGRSNAQANVALPDKAVSRVHFQIENRNGQVWVIDQGSSGGTLVNGRKVMEQQLKSGDIIRAGDTQLRFAPAGEDVTFVTEGKKDRVEDIANTTFSHFKVGKLIARGTTGCVFKAVDTETGQTVALKVLFPEMAKSEEEMQRFVRAMKTIIPLQHPNLIKVINAGRKDSFCWLAMEFIEGDSLAKLIERVCREGKLPWGFSLKVAIHLSRALQYADERDFLHRNITPNNILIRISDQSALLGDLMLAKALEGALAAQITKPGQMIGEVKFMSPERTRSTTDVDIRSEIYSLGATLYALLTGKPPHEGLTLVDTLKKIREVPPIPVSQSISNIPKEFDAVILKMLEKDPAKRFQTPKDLTQALEAIAKKEELEI